MTTALFMYHSGHHALVYPNPEKMGFDQAGNIVVQGYIAFPTKFLRDFGWKAADDDFARCLPRYDMPLIVPPTAGVDPRKMQQIQNALRGGRR